MTDLTHSFGLESASAPPRADVPTRRRLLSGLALTVGLAALPAGRPSVANTEPREPTTLRARAAARRPGDRGEAAPVWGYDGTAPGPTLRVKRGEELQVRLVNELPEPTAIHWHGLRGANATDGVPHLTQAPVGPNTAFDYRLRPPDAGTFWYHPAGDAAGQTGLGLRGALIVEDVEPVSVDRDVLAFFEDWPSGGREAAGPGGHFTVNGSRSFDIAVRPHERLRLRLVNACLARVLTIRIEGHPAWVMAIDGQPAEPFRARESRLSLAPGNRVDLFIDMVRAPGARSAILVQSEGHPETAIANLAYEGEPVRAVPFADPAPLPQNPLPARLDMRSALRHELALDALRSLPDPLHERQPVFRVQRGRVVVLALAGRAPQAVHLHGHHFRLLDRLDDGWKPFWLDTIPLGGGRTERIAFLADNPGRWLLSGQTYAAPFARAAAWFEVT